MAGRVLPGRGSHLSRQRLHHSGTGAVRVLLIGDRAQLLAGPGATLAQRAVDRIWLTTRRGVDLDVLADASPVLEKALAAFGDWRLWRYDAIVVAVDPDSPLRQRTRLLQQVQDLLVADERHATPVVLLTADRGRHRGPAVEERRLLERADAADALHLAEVPFEALPDERLRGWAAVIGAEVARWIEDDASAGEGPQDEEARQQALDELGVVGRPPDPRLNDLVELARTAFGAESAEINFIDHDRQWKMAVAGAVRGENPRAHSFCSQTITRPEPLVVGDARLDPVLRLSPLVRGSHPIRFYAAHPIESIDGYRIGSFCVYDSEPRDVRGLDLAVLRDLALLAQAELIAHDRAPEGAAERLREG